MCYNKTVSLLAYASGLLFTSLLFVYGDKYDKHFSIFAFAYIQMQLVEFFMWYDEKCGNINNYASRFALLILILQPIVVLYGAILFKTTIIPNYIIYSILITYLIIITFNLLLIENRERKLCSKKPNNSDHLKWDIFNLDDNLVIYYLYFIALFIFIFFKNFYKGLFIVIFGSVLREISIYQYDKYDKEWYTIWCFKASVIPIVLLLSNYLLK
tara:strand:- start:322 stop:960 length:639 start_codon:yes stop_codon:yes gene_type:complete